MAMIDIDIFDYRYTVEFYYRITYAGRKETYFEPAEPMEFDIDDIKLFNGTMELEVPEWLKSVIIDYLLESEEVYDKIVIEEKAWFK